MKLSTQKGFRGFSLIELLVVMAILGILMVLTIPAVTAIQKAGSLTKAGNDIASFLKIARTHAMANNISVWVGFSNAVDGVRVGAVSGRVTGGDSDASPLSRVILHPNIRIVSLPPDAHRPSADAQLSAIDEDDALDKFTLGSTTFDYVIQFTGQGAAKVAKSGMSKRMEIALQQAIDGNVTEATKNNYLAVQIGGLTGNIGVYRP